MGIWKKFTTVLNHPIVQLIGLPGAIALITWVAIKGQEVPLWLIWLALLFSVGCVFWIANQVGVWKERHKKRIIGMSDTEIEKTIREWLDWPSFAVRRQDHSDAKFLFLVIDRAGRNFSVLISKQEPTVVQIVTEVDLAMKDVKLSQENWELVASRLSVEMARLGIQFLFTGEPNKFQQIMLIEQVILDDSLTDYIFRERVMFVARALVLVKEVVNAASRVTGKPIDSVSHEDGLRID